MQQGLRLLLQLVLEFAPVIANLVQKRFETNRAIAKLQLPKVVPELVELIDIDKLYPQPDGDLEKEKDRQQQAAAYQRQTQIEVANLERETALKLPEFHKILDSWPLRLYPSQILEKGSSCGRTPLKIFIAPPKIQFDKSNPKDEELSDIELMLASGLRDFLNKHYSLHSQIRPTEFLAGAWDSKRFHSESSIKALFGMLKTEPILILESETDGDYINFRIAYWGLGQDNYYYHTISRINYKEIVCESAKSRANEWRKIRDDLLALGESIEEINKIGGDNAGNLALLEKAEKWEFQGIDLSKLSLPYQIIRQDEEKLSQVLTTCHCLVTGWVADIYHLIHHDVRPLLPELLPNMLNGSLDLTSLAAIASGYKQVYQALEKERCFWIPELALQLAISLCYLPSRTWAQEQLEYSLHTWLQMRGCAIASHPLSAMQQLARAEDGEYVEKLREYFLTVGDRDNVTRVEEILSAIESKSTPQNTRQSLNRLLQLEQSYRTHTLKGHLDKVTSVAISSDGQTLVSGCADKSIKVWDLTTGNLIRTLTANIGEVSSVAVSPDGNFLAVGSSEHPKSNVKVWNLKTGKLLHTLLGHQKPVNFVAISPDGKILASGSNKIKIWNLHNGDRICTLWHSSPVHAAAISPDGTILVSGSSDKKIRLWNPVNGDPLRTLAGHSGEVNSVAIAKNGELLVSGSADKTIKIWHLDSGRVLYTLSGHTDEVKSVVISPDGQTLFSASADKSIKIWRLQTGELLQTLTGHSAAINSIAVSDNGQFLASASSDQTIKIWQPA